MTELISRQAALAAIDKNRDALLSSGMAGAEHILVHYGRRVIEELPTIDTVKRGKWNDHTCMNWHGWHCSVCDHETQRRTKYCPNCGARMEKSE